VVSEEKGRAAVLTEVALIFAALFWGMNFAATKYAADFLPQLFIVAFRFIGGGLLLLLVLRTLNPESRLRRKDLLPMMGLGCFGIGAAQTAFTFGISLTSAASTGLVFTTAPVWGMVLGFVLGFERPGWKGVVGVGLCILGVGMVLYGGLSSEDDSLLGDLVILLAAMCVGAYTVLSMPMLRRHSPLAVATYPTLFGGPVVLLLSLPYLPKVEWGSLGAGPWAALAYSAIRRVAEGHQPHRGEQGAHLPVPHHLHGGDVGCDLLRRGPHDRQDRGRRRHPRRGVPSQASVEGPLTPPFLA
jgi:drug/metabolite transporter (DMT)-like permease